MIENSTEFIWAVRVFLFHFLSRQLELHRLPKELRVLIRLYLESPPDGNFHYWYNPKAQVRALDLLCLCRARKFKGGEKLPYVIPATRRCSVCNLPQNVWDANATSVNDRLPHPAYTFHTPVYTFRYIWPDAYPNWPQVIIGPRPS